MLNELKKYAEEQAERHHKKAQYTKENQSYHLGQRDAYESMASIIEAALSYDELNRYILIRYDVCRNQVVEGYFGTADEAKDFARKTFPNDAISIYELAENCVDLADE